MTYIDLGDPKDDRYVDVSDSTLSPRSHVYLAVSDGECEVGVKLDREECLELITLLGDWYRGEA